MEKTFKAMHPWKDHPYVSPSLLASFRRHATYGSIRTCMAHKLTRSQETAVTRSQHHDGGQKGVVPIIATWRQWASLYDQTKSCRNCQQIRNCCHPRCTLFSKGKTNKLINQSCSLKSAVVDSCTSSIPALTQPEPIWWPCSESSIYNR